MTRQVSGNLPARIKLPNTSTGGPCRQKYRQKPRQCLCLIPRVAWASFICPTSVIDSSTARPARVQHPHHICDFHREKLFLARTCPYNASRFVGAWGKAFRLCDHAIGVENIHQILTLSSACILASIHRILRRRGKIARSRQFINRQRLGVGAVGSWLCCGCNRAPTGDEVRPVRTCAPCARTPQPVPRPTSASCLYLVHPATI